MKRFLLSFGLLATMVGQALQAGQLPLTVSEISLMLRAGYSSNTLIKELSTRHFVDVVDEAKEKTLINSGASAELIAALKSGTYSLSAEKTAAMLQQMAALDERRAVEAEISRKSDARYQAQVTRERTSKSPAPSAAEGAVPELLKGDLVQYRNGSLTHFDDSSLANKKLIAVYFSAHWCGPCRKFTPQLVEYYNRVAPQHPEFEIVFYSHDRSPADFETYMHETNMPWPAIDFAKLKGKQSLTKNAGPGIPSLVLFDSSGKLISSSYAGSQYRGPQQVLADLDAIFAGKMPARFAAAP
ncbi:MAG TPA: thioredoxin-like domain-containing protein [Chthoniobacterales bacterium]|jgi:nucleoredoxin|nr:thioredoxin-like domain-containing protein [Chthoniobacterales bacterium]